MGNTTHRSILEGVKKNDSDSWERFYLQYKDLAVLIGSKDLGCSQETIEDVWQIVASRIYSSEVIQKYVASTGKFRTYLNQIIRNEFLKYLKKSARSGGMLGREKDYGETIAEISSATPDSEADFLRQHQAFLLALGKDRLAAESEVEHYMVFQQRVEQGQDIKVVAQNLGMTEKNVYQIAARMTKRLEKIVHQLERELSE